MTPKGNSGSGSISRRSVLTRGGQSAVLLGLGTVAFAGTASATFCPRTPGFWKNHPDAWPTDSLEIGQHTYSKSELMAFLSAPTKGDKSLILGKHLIAYMLNTRDLHSSCDTLGDAHGDAVRWLNAVGGIGSGVRKWKQNVPGHGMIDAEPLKDQFDAFNNGQVPLNCDHPCVEWSPNA